MLLVILVDGQITGIYVVLTGRYEILPAALLLSLGLLGLVNLLGAFRLFRPVAAWLDGRASLGDSRRAIHRLPGRCTLWILAVALAYGAAAFYTGLFTPPGIVEEASLAARAAMFVWFLFVYATYMGFAVYFAVTDVVARIRLEVFRREGVALAARPGRVQGRLVLVFAVVTVMPVALVALDLSFFGEIRRAQGLSVADTMALDLGGALLAALLALVFVTRSLVKPIDWLVEAVRRVGRGDLTVRVPVTSDDELGVLAGSFNRMVEGLAEREYIRETFGKYVSADVAEAVLRRRRTAPGGRLDGETVPATILFSDIAGFSDLCEELPAGSVLELLNEYLALVGEPIAAHGGVINQFIGDAVLATFNVPVARPDHAPAAVRAALEIQTRLAGHRFAGGRRLATRIGVNTGEVVAGSVGPADRLHFTVLGATVNLAAQLEALGKRHGPGILIGPETRARCGAVFAIREVGTIPAKGGGRPVQVFQVLGERALAAAGHTIDAAGAPALDGRGRREAGGSRSP